MTNNAPNDENVPSPRHPLQGSLAHDRWVSILRVGVRVFSISLFLILIWTAGTHFLRPTPAPQPVSGAVLPTSTPAAAPASIQLPDVQVPALVGVTRLVQLHTILPERPRFEVSSYTVQEGDTIFGIAEKFGLKPQTIMWGNWEGLGDDPHLIRPGLSLVILPMDGAYHKWSAEEGLNRVSEYFHVKPEDIIGWPGNHLTLESVGDFSHPNIQPGTMLFIPGGRREYISKIPTVPRKSPGVANYLGPGACSAPAGGAVGTGTFVWPVRGTLTTQFSPETNHPAIDIATALGTSVVASDTGVVVYAGATYDNIGYGNLVIIDHGNGWQTLYAHLSAIYVTCGSGIFQGASIGAIGSTGRSTGPHLHFQMNSSQYGRANPMNFLP